MKRFYSILVAFACLLLLSSNAISQTWTPVEENSDWYFINGVTMESRDSVYEIAEVPDYIELDDESAQEESWDATPWYDYQVYGKKAYTEEEPPSADDFTIQWKALWDDESVYFLAKVKDDNIIYDDSENVFWGQDGFEFYFLPHEDISTALGDNGQINRDDSTMVIFHAILADYEGNPVKLAHPAGGADGQSTPTEEGWRWAGGQTHVRYCTAQSFEEDGFLYYEWKVNTIEDLPCAGDKDEYAAGDVVRAELKFNEADDILDGNREIMAQIAAYGDEAKKVPNTFPYLKLVEEVEVAEEGPIQIEGDWHYAVGINETNIDTIVEINKVAEAPEVDDEEIEDEAWESASWNYYQTMRLDDASVNPDGPTEDDFNARWKAVWDEDATYFLIHITDDVISVLDGYEKWWQQDCIEFYYSPDNEVELNDDGLGIDRNDSTKVIFDVIGPDEDNDFGAIWFKGNIKNTDNSQLEGQFIVDGTNVYYELKTKPWDELYANDSGEEPAIGDMTRLELQINEDDDPVDTEVSSDTPRDMIAQLSTTVEARGDFTGWTYLKLMGEGSSVKDFAEANVSVYPNPFSGQLTIEAENNISNIAVYNMAGQIMKQFAGVENNTTTVDLSNLKNGIYYINVKDTKGAATMFKAVKR